MSTTSTIEVTMDDALRSSVQRILADINLTGSDAIGFLYNTIVHEGTLPARSCTPNEETIAAMREAESGNLPQATSVTELRMLREDD